MPTATAWEPPASAGSSPGLVGAADLETTHLQVSKRPARAGRFEAVDCPAPHAPQSPCFASLQLMGLECVLRERVVGASVGRRLCDGPRVLGGCNAKLPSEVPREVTLVEEAAIGRNVRESGAFL